MWGTDDRGPNGCKKTMEDTVIDGPETEDGAWDQGGEGGRSGRVEIKGVDFGAMGKFKDNWQVSSHMVSEQKGRQDWEGQSGVPRSGPHQFAISGLAQSFHFTDGESGPPSPPRQRG